MFETAAKYNLQNQSARGEESPFSCIDLLCLFCILIAGLLSSSSFAADINKANNTTNLKKILGRSLTIRQKGIKASRVRIKKRINISDMFSIWAFGNEAVHQNH